MSDSVTIPASYDAYTVEAPGMGVSTLLSYSPTETSYAGNFYILENQSIYYCRLTNTNESFTSLEHWSFVGGLSNYYSTGHGDMNATNCTGSTITAGSVVTFSEDGTKIYDISSWDSSDGLFIPDAIVAEDVADGAQTLLARAIGEYRLPLANIFVSNSALIGNNSSVFWDTDNMRLTFNRTPNYVGNLVGAIENNEYLVAFNFFSRNTNIGQDPDLRISYETIVGEDQSIEVALNEVSSVNFSETFSNLIEQQTASHHSTVSLSFTVSYTLSSVPSGTYNGSITLSSNNLAITSWANQAIAQTVSSEFNREYALAPGDVFGTQSFTILNSLNVLWNSISVDTMTLSLTDIRYVVRQYTF